MWALSELCEGPASAARLATLALPRSPDAAALAECVLVRLRGRFGDALTEQAEGWRLRFVTEGAHWQLRVTAPDGTLFAVGVDRQSLSVGRASDNDLVLPASEVSRHHAVIRLAADGLEVRDQSSGNGVYVDGSRITRAVVSHGERFEIRPYLFEVLQAPTVDIDSETTRISAEAVGSVTLVACRVDLDTHTVFGSEGETALTNAEWALFDYLRRAAPRAVSRDELLDRVWGYHRNAHSRTVDTTLYRLRTKIERNAREPDHLLTVRGEGYRFVVPVSDTPEDRSHIGTNLPHEAGLLYGRESERQNVEDALSSHPTVSVTGPPGIGKTRLLRALSSSLLERHPEVWYVDLTSAVSSAEAAERIGRTLAVEAGADVGFLLDWVAAHRSPMLLVLDGADACSSDTVIRICAPRPGLQVLIGAWEAPGDALPTVCLAGLDIGSSRALFHAGSGEASHPGYDDDATLDGILEQLDRNPLAIELASRWGGSLPPDLLRSRLSPVPGQTSLELAMAGALEWLAADERSILRQCAMFARTFALVDAEGIIDPGGASLRLVLHTLCRAALAERVLGMEPRFRLLGSVRAYVLEQPREPGAATRHAEWFLRARASERPVRADDADDLRLAVRTFIAAGEGEKARLAVHALLSIGSEIDDENALLRQAVGTAPEDDTALAVGLAFRHLALGDTARGRHALGRVDAAGVSPLLLARMARLHAVWARTDGDLAAARAFAEQARVASLHAADADESLLVELERARIAAVAGPDARTWLRDLVSRFRNDGDREREAEALEALAAAGVGDEEHEAHLLRAIALHRESGRRTAEATALVVYGRRLGERGRHDEARVAVETALALAGSAGPTPLRSRAWRMLADIARLGGDPVEAMLLYGRALAVAVADGQASEADQTRRALVSSTEPAPRGRRP